MTYSFAINHDKNLQIYLFCVKRQAKSDFLKDVESTVASFAHLGFTSDSGINFQNPQNALYYHK